MPGEEIKFNIKINNLSSKKVDLLHIELAQRVRFFSNTGRSTMRAAGAASLKFPNPVNPKSVETYEGHLVVPNVATTSSGLCRIIEVFYELIFTYGASGMSMNEYLTVPIVIGSIPLTGV